MSKPSIIAIFDVGKTNKKLLLFDEHYQIVHEESLQLKEITDEDGFPCEDVSALTIWIKNSFNQLLADTRFNLKAINFSAYGASFVYLDKEGHLAAPLYNYLKPYPPALQQQFYATYGGESLVARETASPVLGSLNSGMQLYRLKYEHPQLFDKIKYALHLPQYLSYVLSGVVSTDITSIGCHTNLWQFQQHDYHPWVEQEQVLTKFPALRNCNEIVGYANGIAIGIGLHDSSAALIPYLSSFTKPFVLISTGTWCISLNPFNYIPLTDDELQQDCLCYLSYEGTPVKASRLFAGDEHEQQVKRLAKHFELPVDYYKNILFDAGALENISKDETDFCQRDLQDYNSYELAYHQLIADIMVKQKHSTSLVLQQGGSNQIFVDGGFSSNEVYMHLLAMAFPEYKVFAASVPQASALGAALSIHTCWNTKDQPINNAELKYYSSI